VSGYLERLVGRHVEPSAVRPRAVSRFEGDLVGGAGQVDTEEAEARPAAAAAAPEVFATPLGQAADVSTALPAEHPIGRPNDRSAAVRVDWPQPAETAATAVPWPAALAAPPRTDDSPKRRRNDEPAAPLARDAPTVAPVAIRRAEPPGAVAPPNVGVPSARRSVVLPSPKPDVVHVHIGRVEVRATVPTPEAPRPAPRPVRRPAPLSLDRYLAGERRS
jgi:hypothetical protein